MLDRAALERAFDYIRQRPQIWEVIVTGGDPFLLAPRRIAEIVRTLDQIPHLGVIRFHTRVPVVDPRRVSARAGRGARGGKGGLCGDPCEPPARADAASAGGAAAAEPRRHPVAVADGPVARRQ